MPTLNRRTDSSTKIHPRQTEFFIKAKPPDVGFITYQVDARAAEFLTEELEYRDRDQVPWSIVSPLRHIRDLYTLDEGKPLDSDEESDESRPIQLPSIESTEVDALVEYLDDHPDVKGDLGSFKTHIKQQDSAYVHSLQRKGYTPVETPGFDSSGNDTLDRIAQEYFGNDTGGYIVWKDERIYDYIEVADRDGNTHKFPKIESRLSEGELLRLSRDIYERWGAQIGESEVISRRYDPDDDNFPNRWIGQRIDSPEPNLKHAESPRAFFYRTIAGRSHYSPGTRAEDEFEAACEYSLEVYKANFPVAVDPEDLQTEYVTVEEAPKPWNDFQVPPRWQEKFPDDGGLPPLKRDMNDLPEPQRLIIRRHSPGGDDPQWFSSVAAGREFMHDHPTYARMLARVHQLEAPVNGFDINGIGELTFELKYGDVVSTVEIGTIAWIDIELADGIEIGTTYDGEDLSGLTLSTLSPSEAIDVLESLKTILPEVVDFADTMMEYE